MHYAVTELKQGLSGEIQERFYAVYQGIPRAGCKGEKGCIAGVIIGIFGGF